MPVTGLLFFIMGLSYIKVAGKGIKILDAIKKLLQSERDLYENKRRMPALSDSSGNQDCGAYEGGESGRLISGDICADEPIGFFMDEDIRRFFSDVDSLAFMINDADALTADIQKAGSILCIGDNCGEICFDKLLIQRIKDLNPQCRIFFGVRGTAIMNDNTEEDAYFVGMDAYADIISNGDNAQGTVLFRTSPAFQEIYRNADVVIAKGQANYETLSEEEKNIYFLLMVKCSVIAEDIGVQEKSLVCLRNTHSLQ